MSKLPKPEVAHILILGSVVAIISATSIGALSQIIGRKPTFLLIGVVNIIALPLLYLHLAHLTAYRDVIGPALLITFLGNAGYAPITIFLNERFPTALRATGTGVSWNLGFAIGGTMPFLVSLLSGSIGGLAPTLASFCAALYLVLVLGALVVPETRGRLQ
uniref:Major facilitator superfamily (MFS) profile domain-containing protein n=1 Tax=Acidicaldus sp. TaxID=1872105 RepID=A0A8J4HD44_9PROT